jgi:hypothetical protein
MDPEIQKALVQLLLQGKLPPDPQTPYSIVDRATPAQTPTDLTGFMPGGGVPVAGPGAMRRPNSTFTGAGSLAQPAIAPNAGMMPSPGMLPQGPSAPPPMSNPNPMAQPSYRPPVGGSVPPLDPDLMRDALRGTYDESSRFDDSRATRVADVGGLSVGPMNVSDDTPLLRGVMKDEIDRRNLLSRLDNIAVMIEENPDLIDATTTVRGDMKSRFLGLKDRFGFDLDPDQQSYLGDSAAFRQTVLTNVNDYIKEITGAQVGQGDETKRLMGALPNLGDSPTEFKAKLANAISMTRLQVARYNYMRQNGTDDRPSDSELTRILRDRGSALYREALDGGMEPGDARLQAASRLSEEFGI